MTLLNKHFSTNVACIVWLGLELCPQKWEKKDPYFFVWQGSQLSEMIL